MIARFFFAILLAAVGIRVTMAAAPAPARTDRELCAELTRELNISAERGLLTQSEADKISARCYRLYGGKTDV